MIYAIHIDGPLHNPNKKQLVEIVRQIDEPPNGRFLCRVIGTNEELVTFRENLQLSWQHKSQLA